MYIIENNSFKLSHLKLFCLFFFSGGGGGYSWEFLVRVLQTKKCHFSHSSSDLAANKLCHHYHHYLIDKNGNKKDFLKSLFLIPYSFGIEPISTFMLLHSFSFLENHTRFQTKLGKV